MNLNIIEKEKAKENGFVLLGKTGAGKTTLINAVFNKIMGKAERSSKAVTKKCSLYYYKLKNNNIICLIDTPGLSDTETIDINNIDDIHLDEIIDFISKENISIKGILYLINFQGERFDADEQKTLLKYNKIFPFKNFWKILVIIYTHFFVGPYEEEDEESIIKKRNITNEKLFNQLMEKVKDVSDMIDYNNLRIKYLNSFSEPKNEMMKKYNDKTRVELEKIFEELC